MKTNTILSTLIFLFVHTLCVAQSAEYGMAAYYSDKYDGNKTASGETYHKNDMVASHKTLPFGTKVKVTRLDNRKSVVVKIIDRGPYTEGRIIDVSRKAAELLDLTTAGIAKVKVEIESADSKPASVSSEPKPTAVNKPPKEEPAATRPPEVKKEESVAAAKPAAAPKPSATKPVPVKPTPLGLHKLQMVDLDPSGYGVQVGTYTEYEGMMKTVKSLQKQWFKNIVLHTVKGAEDVITYRIILGPIDNQKSAQAYNKSLKEKGIDGFVVNLGDLK